MLNSVTEETREHLAEVVTPDAVRRGIAEEYVQKLDRMTNLEAAEHLRSVDESHIRDAYALLADRLDHATLARICMDYLSRPGRDHRFFGASGIGSCLKGTGNKEACRALALMIRNSQEETDIRLMAHMSLEIIDWGRTPLHGGATPRPTHVESELEGVDWSFVDSFL